MTRMEHPTQPSAAPPVFRFNLNDTIRVKLTDHGRAVLRKQRLALAERLPEECHARLLEFKQDAEGWSTWQAWALMHEFGRHMVLGWHEPMEMTIEIPLAVADMSTAPDSPDLQTAAAQYRAAVAHYRAMRDAFVNSPSDSDSTADASDRLDESRTAMRDARDVLAEAAIQPAGPRHLAHEDNAAEQACAALVAEVDELKRQLAHANQHREDLMRINGEWTAWGAEVLGTHTSDDGYRQSILHMLGAKVGPRQSITKFLNTECERFAAGAQQFDAMGRGDAAERCRIKASHTRTLAIQVERGRDMDGEQLELGGEAAPVDLTAELLAAAVTFRDAESAWHAAAPTGEAWASPEVVGTAGNKQRAALDALCVAAVRTANAMRGAQ